VAEQLGAGKGRTEAVAREAAGKGRPPARCKPKAARK
jgi:hypothetical protein